MMLNKTLLLAGFLSCTCAFAEAPAAPLAPSTPASTVLTELYAAPKTVGEYVANMLHKKCRVDAEKAKKSAGTYDESKEPSPRTKAQELVRVMTKDGFAFPKDGECKASSIGLSIIKTASAAMAAINQHHAAAPAVAPAPAH